MPPQLLGACAVNEIIEMFPLKNIIIWGVTSVHLLVSLTLQDKLFQMNFCANILLQYLS